RAFALPRGDEPLEFSPVERPELADPGGAGYRPARGHILDRARRDAKPLSDIIDTNARASGHSVASPIRVRLRGSGAGMVIKTFLRVASSCAYTDARTSQPRIFA